MYKVLIILSFSLCCFAESNVSLNVGIPKTQGIWYNTQDIYDIVDIAAQYDINITSHSSILVGADIWFSKDISGLSDTILKKIIYPYFGISYLIPFYKNIEIANNIFTGPCFDIRPYRDTTQILKYWLASIKLSPTISLDKIKIIIPYFQIDYPVINFIDREEEYLIVETFQYTKIGIGISLKLK